MGEIRAYGKHNKWTEDEINQLKILCEKYPLGVIARKLGRTPASIKSKMQREGIFPFIDQTDLLILKHVAELTGRTMHSIRKTWMITYGANFRRLGTYQVISEGSLIKFMRANPNLWKASECDYYYFCRFKWFRERLEAEKKGEVDNNHYRNYRSWSTRDISRFKAMKRKGMTHMEIASELGRTKYAVDHFNARYNKETCL